jgi:hypothetical protein
MRRRRGLKRRAESFGCPSRGQARRRLPYLTFEPPIALRLTAGGWQKRQRLDCSPFDSWELQSKDVSGIDQPLTLSGGHFNLQG